MSMKRFVLGFAACLIMATAMGTPRQFKPKGSEERSKIQNVVEKTFGDKKIKIGTKKVRDAQEKAGRTVRSIRRAPSGNVTITTPVFNDYCMLNCIIMVNDDNYYEIEPWDLADDIFDLWGDEQALTVDIEPGTYFIMAEYWNYPEDPMAIEPNLVYSFKEEVEIGSDSELSFSPKEATNYIQFKSICPDGKPAVLPTLLVDEDYNITWVDDDATVSDVCFNRQIVHEKYGILADMFGNAGYIDEDGVSGEVHFDFLTSNVSDKVWFLQGRMLPEWEGNGSTSPDAFYTLTGIAGCDKEYTLVENGTEGFVAYNGKVANSPASQPADERALGLYSTVEFTFLLDEKQAGGYSTALTEKNPATPVYISETMAASPMNPRLRVQLGSIDLDLKFEEYFPDEDWSFVDYYQVGIISYPAVLVDGEWATAYFGNCEYNFSYQIGPDGIAPEFPGNPAFYHSNDLYLGEAGNNAPIVVCMDQVNTYEEEEGDLTFFYIEPYFIGRVGEFRETDLTVADVVVERDGESVFEGKVNELNDWIYENAFDGHKNGLVTLTTTDKNIAVDGIPGYNVTTMKYDETKEDRNFPTLQMLWFKNNEGFITDKFESAEDGVIELTGADFNWYNNGDDYWFNAAPVELTVEYAPHNSQEWAELEVEEIASGFYMPGYGYFWRGNLSQVDALSDNGWFDIRVSMVDESGNSQVQAFGPAFYIEDNYSEVKSINSGSLKVWLDGKYVRTSGADNVELTLIGIDGKTVSHGADLGELPSGLWIVKANAGSQQVVKKVIVK